MASLESMAANFVEATEVIRAKRIEAAAQKMYRAYREFGELHALMPEWPDASERLRDEFRAMARSVLEG